MKKKQRWHPRLFSRTPTIRLAPALSSDCSFEKVPSSGILSAISDGRSRPKREAGGTFGEFGTPPL